MNDIFIFDDILTLAEQHTIDVKFHSNKVDWYYNSSTVNYNSSGDLLCNKNIKEHVQLTHVLLSSDETQSKMANVGLDILQKFLNRQPVDFSKVSRIKANLMTQFPSYGANFHTTPHIDSNENHWVLLYYVNDSDGCTIIFENSDLTVTLDKIQPKKGRFVLFPGHLYHAGQFPEHSSTRIVLNYNLLI